MPALRFICDCCPREVAPPVAQMTARAVGRVLCDRCRRELYQTWPVIHQVPTGTSATIWPSGYGRFTAELLTSAGTFYGAGSLDHTALMGAIRAAREAGAVS